MDSERPAAAEGLIGGRKVHCACVAPDCVQFERVDIPLFIRAPWGLPSHSAHAPVPSRGEKHTQCTVATVIRTHRPAGFPYAPGPTPVPSPCLSRSTAKELQARPPNSRCPSDMRMCARRLDEQISTSVLRAVRIPTCCRLHSRGPARPTACGVQDCASMPCRAHCAVRVAMPKRPNAIHFISHHNRLM